jgi:cell division initiation protein
MEITPLDIRKQEFKRAFRGYDTMEVRMFLDVVAEQLEAVVRDRADLADSVNRMEKDLAEFKEKERLLQSAIVSAERLAEETLQNARREGELTVKDAELSAERMLTDARREVTRVRAELEDLRIRRNVFLAKMKSFLQSQLDILVSELEDTRTEPVPEAHREA